MYSLVLMMALGNGATTPSVYATEPGNVTSYATHSHALSRRGGRGCHRCHGCYGCYCYGCYGCYSCYGGCYGGDHGAPPPAKGGEQLRTPPKSVGSESAAPATVVVTLPADAKLRVDDQTTRSTSDRRIFTSPPLDNGKEYYYTLKAEINRDGKPITATKRVTVQAGKETEIKIDFDTSSVAAR
jgi:uncharacterized protein (TIGR03000 family)